MIHLSHCNSVLKVLIMAKAMIKTALYVFAILTTLMVLVHSTPPQKRFEDTYQPEELGTGHVIVKRTTCEFWRFPINGLKLNACTVHCISTGKKSGYCTRSNVCICRK